MKWREARPGPEQRQAVAEALRDTKSKKDAARVLGIGRQYLHRLLAMPAFAEAVSHVATGYAGDTGDAGSGVATIPGVAISDSKPLTYPRPAPTFPRVSTAIQITTEEVKVPTTMAIKKAVKDWAELRALNRKQREGGRGGIAKVFEELAEREMAREEEERLAHAPAATPKKIRKGKTQDGEK